MGGQGNYKEKGLNRLAVPGLIKRIIGAHLGPMPKIKEMIVKNQIECFYLPRGVMTHLFRDIAAHKPGTITQVGLKTFADPRICGCRFNDPAKIQITA